MKSKTGYILLGLFFLPFFLVGLYMSKEIFEHVQKVNAAKEWQQVPAKVRFINSTFRSSGDGDTKIIKTEFNYHYQGRDYVSTKAGIVNEGGFGTTFDAWEEEIKNKLRRGKLIEAWANPNRPSQAVLFRGLVWDHILFMGIFVITFGGVGLGGILFLAWAWKEEKFEQGLKNRYPTEPWRWRRDWEHGKLGCSSKTQVIGLWALAIFWNSLCSFTPFLIWDAVQQGEYWVLLALILPLIGLGLIRAAIKKTYSYRRHGKSSLVLNTHPGVIGGNFSATFLSPSSIKNYYSMKAKLVCNKTERSGDDTYQRTIWESERNLDQHSLGNLNISGATFDFTIPFTCPESNEEEDISWKLSIEAEADGPNLTAEFDVPVFQTSKSNPEISEHSTNLYTNDVSQAEGSKLAIDYLSDGGVNILIPSVCKRSPGFGVSLGLFALIFGAIGAAMIYNGSWLFSAAIFLFSSLAITLAILILFFSRKNIQADTQGVTVKTSGILSKEVQIPISEIEAVSYSVSSSSTSGNKKTDYYLVFLKLKSGTRKTLVYWVMSKATAQWIVSNISEALGLGNQVLIDPESLGPDYLNDRLKDKEESTEEKPNLDWDQLPL